MLPGVPLEECCLNAAGEKQAAMTPGFPPGRDIFEDLKDEQQTQGGRTDRNVSPFGSTGAMNHDKHAPIFPLPALATLPDYLSPTERRERGKRKRKQKRQGRNLEVAAEKVLRSAARYLRKNKECSPQNSLVPQKTQNFQINQKTS